MADDLLLDDPDALLAVDTGGRLRSAAAAGAEVRSAATDVDRDALARLAADGRPRGLLVVGAGPAALAGDVLVAVTGPGSPLPVLVHRGLVLPGWVGPLDVVVAMSPDGRTPETVATAEEAVRRGARLVTVAPSRSPLAAVAEAVPDSVHLPVAPTPAPDAPGPMLRAGLWAGAVPLLLLGEAWGLCALGTPLLDRLADDLDETAVASGLGLPLVDNPAKSLGLALAESLPVVWGTGDVGPVAATRLADLVAAEAGVPVVHGSVADAVHGSAAILGGPLAGALDVEDIFRDRVAEPDVETRVRMVLLRDAEERPLAVERARALAAVAERRGVPVSVLTARGDHRLLRLASLVGPIDWAVAYAGLALGGSAGDAVREVGLRVGED